MSPDPTGCKVRLAVVTRQSPAGEPRLPTFPLPGESQFPGPPAMPAAMLRLEMCLSSCVADLQSIVETIKSDVGLMVQVLRLASLEGEEKPGSLSIAEIVVRVGIEKLRILAAQTRMLPNHPRTCEGLSEYERFWWHARLAAIVAEDLAGQSSEVNPEMAYAAGLLFHIGDLPSLLGWQAGSNPADSHRFSQRMAKAWQFPEILVDLVSGDRAASRTRQSCALFDIVESAENWAYRLEFLAVREYDGAQLGIHSIDQQVRDTNA